MIGKDIPTRVLLPRWIWEKARNKEELKKHVWVYMQRYPNYVVKAVKDGFAICERQD